MTVWGILYIKEEIWHQIHLTETSCYLQHLRKFNNFNSYLAILAALDSAPVRRLEWQKQNMEALKEFCQLIDSSSSFRTYRHALSETDPPCIPYMWVRSTHARSSAQGQASRGECFDQQDAFSVRFKCDSWN